MEYSVSQQLNSTMESPINITTTETAPESVYTALDSLALNYKLAHGYIATVICLFGIVFNSCNIYILSQRNMRSSPTYLLLNALATCDLITTLAYLPFAVYFYIVTDATVTYGHAKGWVVFAIASLDLQHVSHTAAMWLTVSIASFRYIYVCQHNAAHKWCSAKRAYLAIALVILLSTIMCIPTFLCYAVTEVTVYDATQAKNVTISWTGETQICKENGGTLKLVTFMIFGGIIKCCACISLVYFTIMLLCSMHQATKRRKALTGNSSNAEKSRANKRTTVMLIALVLLFVITELPQGILVLISSASKTFFNDVYTKLADLIDLLILINSMVNFLLYTTMSQRFRETFYTHITQPILKCIKKNEPLPKKTQEEYGYQSVPQHGISLHPSSMHCTDGNCCNNCKTLPTVAAC